MHKKLITSGIGFLLLLSPMVASADVASQIAALQALIQQLMVQIAQLKVQQASNGNSSSGFCHEFKTDIQFGDYISKYGAVGGDVDDLHEVLKREGFTVDSSIEANRMAMTRKFGESTRAAVIKFQAKYGIKQTGYVGPLTRAQLNRLYGCGNTSVNTGVGFSASPTSGPQPLTVTFTYPFSQDREAPIVNFGDGSESIPMACSRSGCTLMHTYYLDTEHYPSHVATFSAKLIGQKCSSCTPGMVMSEGQAMNATWVPYTIATVTITVSGASQSDISVPGMSTYTDTDFGFSFWYPNGWTVEKWGVPNPTIYTGGTVLKKLLVGPGHHTDLQNSASIEEYSSPNMSITIPYNGMDEGGPTVYYFDATNHQWMERYEDAYRVAHGLPLSVQPADVSKNTMGGLHMLYATSGHGCYYTVIPLSAHNFLVAGPSCGPHSDGSDWVNETYLVKTIVASDASVATPVSATEQTATIQAEKDAYTH